MKIKKFDKYVNENSISGDIFKAIAGDILSITINSYMYNKKCTAICNDISEKCTSILDAIDFILSSIKVSDKKYKAVNIEDGYALVDINDIAGDYGFNDVKISFKRTKFFESQNENLTILVSDKRYIKNDIINSIFKNKYFEAGKIILKQK